jgi:dephospho-CoA kinase
VDGAAHYAAEVAKVLITGMSGTGKSSVLRELRRRGYRVVDIDSSNWSIERPLADGSGAEQLWRTDVMGALLAEDAPEGLFVAGCASNQGLFYDRFDAVVLLSTPREVLLERIATRTTNSFGKTDAERKRIIDDLESVEPLLRATARTEINAGVPLIQVVDTLDALARRIRREDALS